MTGTDTSKLAEQYAAFWNAADADQQHRIAASTFADDVSYYAPVGVMHGVDELIGFRNQFAQHSPGYEFRTQSSPQAHHGRVRLQWDLVVAGTPFAAGTDVFELDARGRITAVTTFLDRAPEGFATREDSE
jgi:hypothetical protein